jgi:hypothetical protein
MKFLIGALGLGAELPNEIRVLKCVGVFNLESWKVTHGLGLYKTGVGLQGYNVISEKSVYRLCMESGASTLTVLCAAVQGVRPGISTSLVEMPAVGMLCLSDGAHAVPANQSELWPSQDVHLVTHDFPLREKLCSARAIEWTELCVPLAHS